MQVFIYNQYVFGDTPLILEKPGAQRDNIDRMKYAPVDVVNKYECRPLKAKSGQHR